MITIVKNKFKNNNKFKKYKHICKNSEPNCVQLLELFKTTKKYYIIKKFKILIERVKKHDVFLKMSIKIERITM